MYSSEKAVLFCLMIHMCNRVTLLSVGVVALPVGVILGLIVTPEVHHLYMFTTAKDLVRNSPRLRLATGLLKREGDGLLQGLLLLLRVYTMIYGAVMQR